MKNRKETNRIQKFNNRTAFNRLKRIALTNEHAGVRLKIIDAAKYERQLFEMYRASKNSQPARPNQRKRRKLARQVPHGK